MADERVVQAYAQALFEEAVTNWLTPLKSIAASLAKAGLVQQLDDKAMTFAQKQEMLKALVPANTAPQVQNLVSLLVSKNQIHLVPGIVAQFERYAQRGAVGAVAKVTSAVALIDAERSALEPKMRAQFGNEIVFEYAVDADLIGGMIVRVGDKVLDASVAGKLAALKEKLK